jgi:hypothetical protein
MKLEHVRNIVTELSDKEEDLRAKLQATQAAIKAVQAVCPHDMKDDGHDSHYNWFKCSACGHEERG